MIVLDTHVWIWWINGSSELSRNAQKQILNAKSKNGIFISSISTWEVALLVKNGRLMLSIPLIDWILKCEQLPFIRFVPVDNRIAEQSVSLPDNFHKDPADRIIIATARHLNMTLITSDEKILQYKHVKSKW